MLLSAFSLDPRLVADTLAVGDLALSRVLLMDDSRFPWLILVPRRPNCREIIDLSAGDRAVLVEEIAACSTALKRLTTPDKLNVGAIGNRVAQLHIHVVARFAEDAAWPEPVWGRGTPTRYEAGAGREFAAAIWSAIGFVQDALRTASPAESSRVPA